MHAAPWDRSQEYGKVVRKRISFLGKDVGSEKNNLHLEVDAILIN